MQSINQFRFAHRADRLTINSHVPHFVAHRSSGFWVELLYAADSYLIPFPLVAVGIAIGIGIGIDGVVRRHPIDSDGDPDSDSD